MGGEEREFVAMSPEAGMSAIVKNKKKKESISISSIVLSTLGHARVMRELATLDRADSILSARNRPGIGQESVDCFHSSRFPIRLCLSGRLARRL